jgi:hypothetical protein
MRAAHSSAHCGGNDNEENHDADPNHALPRPIPRHPFVDGLVLVRRRRFFLASVAHGAKTVVSCAVGRGCAAVAAL